eukprot:4637711-Pyramimonas_sp.AAC.1
MKAGRNAAARPPRSRRRRRTCSRVCSALVFRLSAKPCPSDLGRSLPRPACAARPAHLPPLAIASTWRGETPPC